MYYVYKFWGLLTGKYHSIPSMDNVNHVHDVMIEPNGSWYCDSCGACWLSPTPKSESLS